MNDLEKVAPLAGAWIEMEFVSAEEKKAIVAPLAGAWIEILQNRSPVTNHRVAPLAGAWIEIWRPSSCDGWYTCRSPYGSVD